MTTLQQFTYGQQAVRTLSIDGEPVFIANDLCAVLDINNPRQALSYLDDDEKGVTTNDTLGGAQQMAYVTEAGMYSLVLRSRKPEAKVFKRWVTHEVLPAIRKTGGYQAAPAPSGQELLALAVVEAQQMLAAKDQRIAELAPAADAWAVVCSTTDTFSIRDAAKCISDEGGVTIGGTTLGHKLLEWGWVYRPNRGDKTRPIRPYQHIIDKGLLTVKATVYIDRETGEKKLGSDPQTRVTGKGLDAIRQKLTGPALDLVPDFDAEVDCA